VIGKCSSTIARARGTAPRAPAVLQVLPHMGAGGVAQGVVEVAGALGKAGFRAVVASAGGPGVAELEAAGATHLTLPLASKNPARIWRNARHLAAAIRAFGIDIVHARSRAPAWSAALAARRTGARFMTTFHGTYGHGNALKRRYNAVMAAGEVVIAISEHIARHVAATYGTDPARIRVIHRGVDARRFDPAAVAPARIEALRRSWGIAGDAPVVMLPGRLTRWKGQLVLVAAMAQLTRGDAVCVLVGDAQGRERYRSELEATIARLGLEGRVRMPGACADMPAACRAADLVVSASTDPEAFGRVLVEAQAMARPVIATAHGGALETVAEGETGWLVPPGDPAALAAALERALALDADARARMGAAGRARVLDRFTTEAMCAATLAVYRELLVSAERRGG
jgi:glycosyltransferase involved in cell wall biosynthesis